MQVERPQFKGITTRAVTIVGIVNGRAMVRDGHGNEFEVRIGMRPKGSGQPAEDEKWIITKKMGMWAFDTMVTLELVPTISGDRTGMHPVTAQVLDALAGHGLVIDTTTGTTTTSLDDDNDPTNAASLLVEDPVPDIDSVPVSDDSAFDAPATADDSVGHERSTTAGRDADDGGGRKPNAPARVEESVPGESAHTTRLSIVSYMQGNQIGPERTQADLDRLDATRADIVAFQGADPTDRDDIYAGWTGWTFYRPTGHGATNAIAWRTAGFDQLDQFTHKYTGGSIDRYVNGVHLRHIASQSNITVMDTQLEPWAAFGGAFLKTTDQAAHVAQFKVQMADLLGIVKTWQSKGPLFLAGNFNVDFRRDHRLRHSGLPYVSFRGSHMQANWDALGLSVVGTVATNTYYDQIYSSIRQTVATPEWQSVLRGYYGPHRPLLVTYRMKRH